MLCGTLLILLPSILVAQNLSECGRSKAVAVANLDAYGLSDALPGEYPYFCSLFVVYNGDRLFLGGATLLQENLLLSLATLFNKLRLTGEFTECQGFTPKFPIFARCGDTNLKVVQENADKQEKLIKRIIFHPEYNNKSLSDDFAILETVEPFQYTQTVGRTCLPAVQDVENVKCRVIGHGTESTESSSSYKDNYQWGFIPLVSNSECESRLFEEHFSTSKGGNLPFFNLHPSFVCAGGDVDKSDTCFGDGGGPLLCQTGGQAGKFVQVGITAWGVGCNGAVPGVYSRVSSALCWINQIMRCNKPAEEIDSEDVFPRELGVEEEEEDGCAECGSCATRLCDCDNILQETEFNYGDVDVDTEYIDDQDVILRSVFRK